MAGGGDSKRDKALTRRRVMWIGAAGVSGVAMAPRMVRAAEPKFYVFLHTPLKTKALETSLGEAMVGVKITAFSRFKDLSIALEKDPPHAVLSYPPVLAANGLKVNVQGVVGGKPVEPYVLMKVGDTPPDDIAGRMVGMTDMLGRKGMQLYLAKIIHGGGAAKIMRVVKVEDLLPLLQFGAADVVLVSKSGAEDIKSKSKQDIRIKEVQGAEVALPALSVLHGDAAKIVRDLGGLEKEVKAALGVESWR